MQQDDGTVAVPPVGLEPLGERGGQPVLVQALVVAQLGDDRAGHLGVVGPLPGTPGHPPGLVAGNEELRAQRVAHRQPVQAVPTEVE